MALKGTKPVKMHIDKCRKCGSAWFRLDQPKSTNRERFAHVIIRCAKCGEWAGGMTYKKTKEGELNENTEKADAYSG